MPSLSRFRLFRALAISVPIFLSLYVATGQQPGAPVSAWQGWRKVAESATVTPALGFDLDRGRLDLVTVGTDGQPRHYRLDGEKWSLLATLEVRSSLSPALAVDAEGVLHLVITGSDGAVLHSRFLNGQWERFIGLGATSATAPVLVYNPFGRALELVIRAQDGQLLHNRFIDHRWGSWTAVGTAAAGDPALGTNFQDSSFDLIGTAADGTLFHRRFAGSWSGVPGLQGGTRLRPVLAVGPTGSLEVAITQADGAVAHNRRVAGRWLGWQGLGFESALGPALVYNTDADALELVAVDRGGQVAHNRMLNGAWTRWWSLPGVTAVATPGLVQSAGGDLELAVAGADGSLWHNRFRPGAIGLVSFERDVQPLFEAHCTSCHEGPRPPMGLGLDVDRSYGLAVNVTSREARRLRRVEAGVPDRSYLYLKLLGTHTSAGGSGTRMPPESSLSPDEIARIRDWIAQGALRN